MDASQSKSITPLQFADAETTIKLAESRSIIDRFFLDWCGLIIVPQGQNKTMQRVSRPTFTYEFARDITSEMYISVNRITARTKYDQERLRAYYRKQCETLRDLLSVRGIHKIVSEEVWQKILEYDKLDPETITENKEGKVTGQTFWLSKYHISWNYNEPVNDDMLRIIKDDFNLEAEHFGQDTILRSIMWSIRVFYEGGLNRSENALTLDHEKMIHKESVVMSGNNQGRSSEGVIERTKEGLKRTFGIGGK